MGSKENRGREKSEGSKEESCGKMGFVCESVRVYESVGGCECVRTSNPSIHAIQLTHALCT